MTQFAIFAALLLAVVFAFLLPPLWLGLRRQGAADRKAANLAIFRQRFPKIDISPISADQGDGLEDLRHTLDHELGRQFRG